MQPVTILFFFLVFLTITSIHFSFCNENHDVVMCMESERQALSAFKQDVVDPSNRLYSWEVEDDFCKWEGVVCNNLTGHVLELHLQNPNTSFDFDYELNDYSFKKSALRGEINPSLLNLKHLKHLDLSLNDFGGMPIPSFIGSLANLRYLNLSKAGFARTIPYQLGNLSSLHFLSLKSSIPNTIGRFASLEYLDLQQFDVSDNLLEGIVFEIHITNLINLSTIYASETDLLHNQIHGDILYLFVASTVQYIYLESNHFSNPLPHISSNLVDLNLSNNSFFGDISHFLCDEQKHLQFLDLGENLLSSEIANC
ncbi:hypothetical protein ACSBR1_005321 [Camellia fascicularis]